MEKVSVEVKIAETDTGFDHFLDTEKACETDRVVLADTTLPMRDRTEANTERGSYDDVEFRIAEVANLLFPDIYRYTHT